MPSVHLLGRRHCATTPVTLKLNPVFLSVPLIRALWSEESEYPRKLSPLIGPALPQPQPLSLCKGCLSPSYPHWTRHRLANQNNSGSLRGGVGWGGRGGVRRRGKRIKAEKVKVKRSHGKRLISAPSHSPGLTPHLLLPSPSFPYLNVKLSLACGFYIFYYVMSFISWISTAVELLESLL